MANIIRKLCLYITLEKYNMEYEHVIHLIPEYKTSK